MVELQPVCAQELKGPINIAYIHNMFDLSEWHAV